MMVHYGSSSKSAFPFRWQNVDIPIAKFNIHASYKGPTISGIEAVLLNGEKSGVFGKHGKEDWDKAKPTLCTVDADQAFMVGVKSSNNVIGQLTFRNEIGLSESMVAYD